MRCRSVTFAWPWDGSGGGCLSAVARKPVYPGLRWSAEWLAGSRKLTFVTLILGSALALLPKARAGCSNAARPDPWRGLWATMIPTPTIVSGGTGGSACRDGGFDVAGRQHVVESADSGLGKNQLEPRKLFRDAGENKMRNDLRRRDRRGAGRCRMGLPG